MQSRVSRTERIQPSARSQPPHTHIGGTGIPTPVARYSTSAMALSVQRPVTRARVIAL